jgi:hypothetical protein
MAVWIACSALAGFFLGVFVMAIAVGVRRADECIARQLRELRESEGEWRDGTDE